MPPEVATELTDLYLSHRDLEHRIQMVNDEQTHTLPTTPEGIARIAAFCGQTESDFRRDLLDRLARTDRLTDGFFAPIQAESGPELYDHAKTIVSDRAVGSDRRWLQLINPRLLRWFRHHGTLC